jgi:hypothetical protein
VQIWRFITTLTPHFAPQIDHERTTPDSHFPQKPPQKTAICSPEKNPVFCPPGALAPTVFGVSHLAVAHIEDSVGNLGSLGVVRNHEYGLIQLAAGLAEHLQDGIGVFCVEVASGLISEHDGGPIDEGAGDGDALLFAAG